MADRPRATTLPGTIGFQAAVAKISSGTSDDIAIWRNNTGANFKVSEVAFTPDTAVTGNTTNNMIIQVKTLTAAGAAAHDLTDATTHGTGTNIVQFVKEALTLSTTAADLIVADGELVYLLKTETGNGGDLPAGVVTIKGEFV